MRAMSLVSSEGDSEQNEMRSLQEKLDSTVTLVAQLSSQLAELKEQVECHFREFLTQWWEKLWCRHCSSECLMNNIKQNFLFSVFKINIIVEFCF